MLKIYTLEITQKGIRSMINIIRNLKIRLKLYILIGVALAGMLMIGGMSFNLMVTIHSRF